MVKTQETRKTVEQHLIEMQARHDDLPEDIANILFTSLEKFKTNEIFNISDDQPASQEEVALYGALLLKMNKPNTLKIEDLDEGMLKDFYKESKKVDNKKIKEFFNYQFLYPSYKEGLDSIINDFI